MDPRNKFERQIAGHSVGVSDIDAQPIGDFADFYEDSAESFLNDNDVEEMTVNEKTMSDQDIKIDALKLAINIVKLQDNATPQDVFNTAKILAEFIKNRKVG